MNEGAKLMQYVEVCLGFFGHGAMHELQPTETMKDVPHILCVYIPKTQHVPYIGYGFSFILCICSISLSFQAILVACRAVFMYNFHVQMEAK